MRVFAAAMLLVAGCSPGENATREIDPAAPARAAVLASLVDPGSAEFGPTRTLPSGIVCGSVNARNRMGGYAGRSPWYFDPRTGTAYVIPAAQNAFGQAWDARQFQRLGCPSGLEHWLSNRELMKLVDEKP